MPIANAYEVAMSFKNGSTDTIQVWAYNASDAMMQAIIAAISKHREGCEPVVRHLGPPSSCWSAADNIKSAVAEALKMYRRVPKYTVAKDDRDE